MKNTTHRLVFSTYCLVLLCCQLAECQTADELATDESKPEAIPLGPAEEAIAASNPTTPIELFRAADQLSQIGRADLAEPYLDRLLTANLQSSALVTLHKTFGTGAFMRLSRDETLSLKAKELTSRVFAATQGQLQDTKRLRQLAKRLIGESDRRNQIRIMSELLDAKSFAVSPLILELTDAPNMNAPSILRSVLVRLGDDAVEPLIAWLDSPDVRARKEAIIVLAKTRPRSAVPFLIGSLLTPQDDQELQLASTAVERIHGRVPNRSDLVSHIRQQADRYYQGVIASQADAEELVEQWIWKSSEEGCDLMELPVRDAANVRALRIYRRLVTAAPNDRVVRLRHWITALSVDKSMNGIDTPLQNAMLSNSLNLNADNLEAVLSQAVRDNQTAAAIAAAELLGEAGSEEHLSSRNGMTSPLAKALTHPNKRLRFAAAMSILKLAPKKQFPGAQQWTDVLGYFSRSRGKRQALIVHPHASVAQSMAAILQQAGIEAQVVNNERAFLGQSVASPDFDLFLISDALSHPPASELIQIVRRDPRTAQIPIGLISRPITMNKSRFIAELNEQVVSVTELTDLAPLVRNIGAVVSTSIDQPLTESKRVEMASRSLDGLKYVVETEDLGVDVTRHVSSVVSSLNRGLTSSKSAEILGKVGSADAQATLLRFANNELRSDEERQAAALAFQSSAKQYGLLLNKSEILAQLEREADDASDPQSAKLKAFILETIKSKDSR